MSIYLNEPISYDSGYDNIVERLITHGASVNAVNKNGNSALQIAASNGNRKKSDKSPLAWY